MSCMENALSTSEHRGALTHSVHGLPGRDTQMHKRAHYTLHSVLSYEVRLRPELPALSQLTQGFLIESLQGFRC